MSKEAEIRRALKAIVGIDNITIPVLGTVVSVDEAEMTCVITPLDSQANITDVKIMGDNEGSPTGFYLKPSVGSIVMISPQDECTYFVSMYSEVDEIWLRGTSNGGIVKASDLVTKLNNLENDINSLKTIFSTTWTPVPNDGGAALKTAAATWAGQTLTPTIDDDIQSTSVKHG